MMHQRQCPFCKTPAINGCAHLALAAEGRDFVNRCIASAQAHSLWQSLCAQRGDQQRINGAAAPEPDDFTWLETAFCDRFLKHLRWFGGMDYEWRTGPKPEQGGFWVLLWSKEPRQLWWELREEIEHRTNLAAFVPPQESSPWLMWMAPR